MPSTVDPVQTVQISFVWLEGLNAFPRVEKQTVLAWHDFANLLILQKLNLPVGQVGKVIVWDRYQGLYRGFTVSNAQFGSAVETDDKNPQASSEGSVIRSLSEPAQTQLETESPLYMEVMYVRRKILHQDHNQALLPLLQPAQDTATRNAALLDIDPVSLRSGSLYSFATNGPLNVFAIKPDGSGLEGRTFDQDSGSIHAISQEGWSAFESLPDRSYLEAYMQGDDSRISMVLQTMDL